MLSSRRIRTLETIVENMESRASRFSGRQASGGYEPRPPSRLPLLAVGIFGTALGSSFSFLLGTRAGAERSVQPCVCKCDCVDSALPPQPPLPKEAWPAEEVLSSRLSKQMMSALQSSQFLAEKGAPDEPCPFSEEMGGEAVDAGPVVDLVASEAALSEHHLTKWGGRSQGKAKLLCYLNNNQLLVDEQGRTSHV